MSELTEEDKKMVGLIIGENIREQFVASLKLLEEKSKLADSRHELLHQKLDRIIDDIKRLENILIPK